MISKKNYYLSASPPLCPLKVLLFPDVPAIFYRLVKRKEERNRADILRQHHSAHPPPPPPKHHHGSPSHLLL